MQVILHDEQAEAGHPGEIRVPLEPVQMRRHLRRRNGEFLDVIEAAAMHLPLGAVDARALALLGVEPEKSSVMK